MALPPVPVSILDRAHARVGQSAADALAATIARAQHADVWGYHRFWVAEHHGVPGIAGSAPAVLVGAVAAHTGRIRVGSGGVMLPNHPPLVVAEQFGTLEALYPGRIDLGVGRSVGFTPAVRAALRQDKEAAERFEADLRELVAYLTGAAQVTARPAVPAPPPLFVLATGEGVDIAARTGLPLVVGGPALRRSAGVAAHPLLDRYRAQFRASSLQAEPYVVASVNVAVAESTDEARDLLLPEAWATAYARTRGDFPPLQPAARVAEMTPRQRGVVDEALASSVYGTPAEVTERLTDLLAHTGADELLVTGAAFDIEAHTRSDERLAELLPARD